jgi:hypothetical protein
LAVYLVSRERKYPVSRPNARRELEFALVVLLPFISKSIPLGSMSAIGTSPRAGPNVGPGNTVIRRTENLLGVVVSVARLSIQLFCSFNADFVAINAKGMHIETNEPLEVVAKCSFSQPTSLAPTQPFPRIEATSIAFVQEFINRVIYAILRNRQHHLKLILVPKVVLFGFRVPTATFQFEILSPIVTVQIRAKPNAIRFQVFAHL